MFTGIFEPAFLQAACAHAAQPTPPPIFEGIIIHTAKAVTGFAEASCTGTITVQAVYNGETQEYTFTNLNEQAMNFNADEDTDIKISGNITMISLSPSQRDMFTLLDAINCNSITDLGIGIQTPLVTLKLPHQLTAFTGGGTHLESLYYDASNTGICEYLAEDIFDEMETQGILYTDSAGAGYNTLAQAATAKGWTVEQLPA